MPCPGSSTYGTVGGGSHGQRVVHEFPLSQLVLVWYYVFELMKTLTMMHNLTNPLQKRELFHLVFLQHLVRAVPVSSFALKGGTNMRLFFGSIRYSEDMDLDVAHIPVHALLERVMAILRSSGLVSSLMSYGIERVVPPNISRAKQTETVQRFKIHLLTSAGEDLDTKVEFSRRRMEAGIRAEPVNASILAAYRMAPIIVPHYTAASAARQKVSALALRRQPQARDVFDLYILSSQLELQDMDITRGISKQELAGARDKIFAIAYTEYRNTVVNFLGPEDREAYNSSEIWDEIRLRAMSLLEGKSNKR